MAGAFGRRLRELRGRAGLSQEALARAVGMSWSTIAKLETSGQDPKWSTVRALARALGVSVTEFDVDDGGEEPAEPKPKRKPGKK